MDAAYLRGTVNEALIEALSSMAMNMPEDKVEYIGQYLLEYVRRKSAQETQRAEAGEAESKYAADEVLADVKRATEMSKANEAKMKAARLADFQSDLVGGKSATSKQEALNLVSSFVAEYLGVQGAYLAVKKTTGETEALHYYSASPGQEMMVGKKLVKAAVEEGDDITPRQGLSFDAFKVPEVAEEEPAGEPEEGAPPKPPPKPLPLIVENCMREKRCKFFGIPKLGSYVAVPISYQSVDHIEGCIIGMSEPPPADPENPDVPPEAPKVTYTASKVPCWMIMGLDTIGEYRGLKPAEISTAVALGDSLAAALESIESKMFDSHVSFLEAHKGSAEGLAALSAALPGDEAGVLETVALQLAPPPVDPDAPPADPPADPPAAAPETLKPYSETLAVLRLWCDPDKGLGSAAFASALASMQNHVLPAPAAVCNLLYVLGLFLGLPAQSLKDVCGDVTWEVLRTVSPSHSLSLSSFSFSSSLSFLDLLLLLLLLYFRVLSLTLLLSPYISIFPSRPASPPSRPSSLPTAGPPVPPALSPPKPPFPRKAA